MLRILRNKKTAKKIWIGLAIIIIPAFALWGFGSSSSNEDEKPVGKIFGKNITALEYKKALAATKTAAI
ncbi:MAG: SurA N-terminal domain-containing protein, partial [Candidatus Omnitrophica bacterium]|nr:SurA N-terminal domain-containing protein [Candidatus Omnitrophota bacterium]